MSDEFIGAHGGSRDDDGVNRLTPMLVGYPEDGGFQHRRVAVQVETARNLEIELTINGHNT